MLMCVCVGYYGCKCLIICVLQVGVVAGEGLEDENADDPQDHVWQSIVGYNLEMCGTYFGDQNYFGSENSPDAAPGGAMALGIAVI
jgi:hypothetical protein